MTLTYGNAAVKHTQEGVQDLWWGEAPEQPKILTEAAGFAEDIMTLDRNPRRAGPCVQPRLGAFFGVGSSVRSESSATSVKPYGLSGASPQHRPLSPCFRATFG